MRYQFLCLSKKTSKNNTIKCELLIRKIFNIYLRLIFVLNIISDVFSFSFGIPLSFSEEKLLEDSITLLILSLPLTAEEKLISLFPLILTIGAPGSSPALLFLNNKSK